MSEHIGYAKTTGKWGISLKRVEGNHRSPERDQEESWLFNDGPRKLRIQAIDKIPELLEQLSVQADLAIKNIKAKLTDVKAVADAVNSTKPVSRDSTQSVVPAKSSASSVSQSHWIDKAMREVQKTNVMPKALDESSLVAKAMQAALDQDERVAKLAREAFESTARIPLIASKAFDESLVMAKAIHSVLDQNEKASQLARETFESMASAPPVVGNLIKGGK